MHDSHLLFITGKSYGTTNLMVFDKAGRQIYGADLVVTANTSNLVTINRSGTNYTYDCAADCRAVMSIGDDQDHFSRLNEQNESIKRLSEGD